MPIHQTLRERLDMPNQVLEYCADTPSSASGHNMQKWPYISGATVWNLTHSEIERTMGFLLDTKFDFPDNYMELDEVQSMVLDEHSYEHILIRATFERVGTAFSVVARALAHVPDFPKLCLASGGSGRNDDDIGRPHWAVLPSAAPPPGEQDTCIAPGNHKVTYKKFALPFDRPENLWAWEYAREALHFARQRGTRYSWIITPEELVVFRHHESADVPGQVTPEIATFSYVPEPGQAASVNVALFFVMFVAGLGHDVHNQSYDKIWIEHKEKLDNIKQAVEDLSS